MSLLAFQHLSIGTKYKVELKLMSFVMWVFGQRMLVHDSSFSSCLLVAGQWRDIVFLTVLQLLWLKMMSLTDKNICYSVKGVNGDHCWLI